MAKATLTFPANSWGRYFDDYVRNIENIFKTAECSIEYSSDLRHMVTPYGSANAIFNVKINGKLVLIDLSDHSNEYCYKFDQAKKVSILLGKMYEYTDYDMPIFKKMHPDIKYSSNVYPYGPLIPIGSLKDYKTLINTPPEFKKPTSGINATNRIYGGAVLTRQVAFSKIDRNKLDKCVSFELKRLPRHKHYKRLRNCIGCLEIGAFPGAQGSGAIEAFLSGVPVISDNMDMILPYGKQIQKHKHYVFIEDDYSNINEAINYVYSHREECVEMAKNVYDLFLETWHPTKLVTWFSKVVEEYYG